MIEGLQEPNSAGVLYDIRTDSLLLAQIAKASQSTGQLGLAVEHGVVGTAPWWEAVQRKDIAILTFVGVIRRVDGGPMGDSAIVRIEGNAQTKSWVPWDGFQSTDIGKAIEIAYVRVPPKHPPRPGFMVELILQVRSRESG
jgi:hypothetical protein